MGSMPAPSLNTAIPASSSSPSPTCRPIYPGRYDARNYPALPPEVIIAISIIILLLFILNSYISGLLAQRRLWRWIWRNGQYWDFDDPGFIDDVREFMRNFRREGVAVGLCPLLAGERRTWMGRAVVVGARARARAEGGS